MPGAPGEVLVQSKGVGGSPLPNHGISYADMPNRAHVTDPRLGPARAAVMAFLSSQSMKQEELAFALKIEQSQVSRFLSGQRKRITPTIRRICQYAGFELSPASAAPSAQERVSQTMRQVLGINPQAADLLAQIVEAVGPLLAQLPKSTSPDQEAP